MNETGGQTKITELFAAMRSTVTDYSEGALEVTDEVDGTAFFPGGSGLWRGMMPHGLLPGRFPSSPIMILGHNFDSVKGHEKSCARGIERMDQGTWKFLLCYLDKAQICPSDCFFTNVFVALQPKRATGGLRASDDFKAECRSFLGVQVRLVKPRLLVLLGKEAQRQYSLAECNIPSVAVRHPGSLQYQKAEQREAIISQQVELLRKALRTA
jgi:hypothetical protein